jgi:hypothetical protein
MRRGGAIQFSRNARIHGADAVRHHQKKKGADNIIVQRHHEMTTQHLKAVAMLPIAF